MNKRIFILFTLAATLCGAAFAMEPQSNERALQKITFILKDSETYEVQGENNIKYLKQCETFTNMLHDFEGEDLSNGINLSNISKDLFVTDILPLLQYLFENKPQEIHNHLQNLSLERLFALINACNYLDVKNLLEAAIQVGAQKFIEKLEKNPQAAEQWLQTIDSLPNDMQTLLSKQLQDHPVFVQKMLNLKPVTLNDHKYNVNSVAFSPHSNLLASKASYDKTVFVYDCSDKNNITLIKTLNDHKDWVNSVAFSPNGKLLASGSKDNTVCVYDCSDIKNITLIKTLNDHKYSVSSVAFSPHSNILASASHDETVCIYDCSDKNNITLIKTLNDHKYSVSSVAFSPNSNLLASASRDNTVCIYDCSDKNNITLIKTLKDHKDSVHSVAFSPNGKLLACALWDKTIYVYDCSDQNAITLIKTLNDHKEGVYSVAFSPDSKLLASGFEDKTVCVYNVGFVNLTLSQILLLYASMQSTMFSRFDLTQKTFSDIFTSMPQEAQQFITSNFWVKAPTQNQTTLTTITPTNFWPWQRFAQLGTLSALGFIVWQWFKK